LEINPRFSAGVEFSYMAGYDFVSGHLDCFAGNPVPAAGVIRQLTIARKYEEYVMREKRDA
jgi:carbamoyl-phosphate synthase large subunit